MFFHHLVCIFDFEISIETLREISLPVSIALILIFLILFAFRKYIAEFFRMQSDKNLIEKNTELRNKLEKSETQNKELEEELTKSKDDFVSESVMLLETESHLDSIKIFMNEIWDKANESVILKPLYKYDFPNINSRKVKIIAVSNYKGGVGKTSISFNLAHSLAQNHNKKVLLIDNDPQANLTSLCIGNIKPTKNIFDVYNKYRTGMPISIEQCASSSQFDDNVCLLAGDEDAGVSLESGLVTWYHHAKLKKINFDPRNIWSSIFSSKIKDINKFDYIIFDCPPSFGMLTQAALSIADLVIIPLTTSKTVINSIRKLWSSIGKLWEEIERNDDVGKSSGLVFNSIKFRSGKPEKEFYKDILGCDLSSTIYEYKDRIVFNNPYLPLTKDFVRNIVKPVTESKDANLVTQFNKFTDGVIKKISNLEKGSQ